MNDRLKVLVVSLCGNTNYGNRLQNLALIEMLKENGYEPISGIDVFSKETITKNASCIFRLLPVGLLYCIFVIKNLFKSGLLLMIRSVRFSFCLRKYINYEHKIIVKDNDINRWLGEYDLYLSGSDQVWNPHFRNRFFYMLGFSECRKRFSYAASISDYNYNFSRDSEYIELINGFQNISVRETTAKYLLERLTKKKITVDLDPTLLLTPEKWRKYSKKSLHLPEKKYLLTYFLGQKDNGIIKKIAEKKKLNIINLNDKHSLLYYFVDPGEFIYIIDNASVVLTDSFHGTVFSVLFHKQFFAFNRIDNERGDTFCRINDFLSLIDMTNRTKKWGDGFDDTDIPQEKWEMTDETLGMYRMQGINVIREFRDQVENK